MTRKKPEPQPIPAISGAKLQTDILIQQREELLAVLAEIQEKSACAVARHIASETLRKFNEIKPMTAAEV